MLTAPEAQCSCGLVPAPALPESVCHVHTDVDPPEMMRIDAQYRMRGDGLIVQTVRQYDDPQPRGEDRAWLRGLAGEILGVEPGVQAIPVGNES